MKWGEDCWVEVEGRVRVLWRRSGSGWTKVGG